MWKICEIWHRRSCFHINKKLDKYVSWHSKVGAIAVDALFLTWDNRYFSSPSFQCYRSNTCRENLWQNHSGICHARLVYPIFGTYSCFVCSYLNPTKTLRSWDTNSLPKNQTDSSKGYFTANMVMKASLQKSTHNKNVSYIKQLMQYVRNIGDICFQ